MLVLLGLSRDTFQLLNKMKNFSKILAILTMMAGLLSVDSSAAIVVRLLPIFGPPKNDPSFTAFMSNAVKTVKSGFVSYGDRTGPTDVKLMQNIGANDLLTTATASFYRGVFNPAGVWAGSRGGTVWWFVDATTDGDNLSLADMTIILSSSDSDNVLRKTVSFTVGDAYSPFAPGIHADGSEVTSGPANQQVKRVIVAIGSPSFPVSNDSDVKAVGDYLNQFPNWRTTAMLSMRGTSTSASLSKGLPMLSAFRNPANNHFIVKAEANGDTTTYNLQASTSLGKDGVWDKVGTIRAGETLDLGEVKASTLFVQYMPRLQTQSVSKLPPPPVFDFTS